MSQLIRAYWNAIGLLVRQNNRGIDGAMHGERREMHRGHRRCRAKERQPPFIARLAQFFSQVVLWPWSLVRELLLGDLFDFCLIIDSTVGKKRQRRPQYLSLPASGLSQIRDLIHKFLPLFLSRRNSRTYPNRKSSGGDPVVHQLVQLRGAGRKRLRIDCLCIAFRPTARVEETNGIVGVEGIKSGLDHPRTWIATHPSTQPWCVVSRTVVIKGIFVVSFLAGVAITLRANLNGARHGLKRCAAVGGIFFVRNDCSISVQFE